MGISPTMIASRQGKLLLKPRLHVVAAGGFSESKLYLPNPILYPKVTFRTFPAPLQRLEHPGERMGKTRRREQGTSVRSCPLFSRRSKVGALFGFPFCPIETRCRCAAPLTW